MPELSIKVKELPEKAALEVLDTDVLIIEDEHDTCQISVANLKTFLFGCTNLQEYLDKIFLDRLELVETLYPFRLNQVTIPTSTGTATWTTEQFLEDFNINQNNVSLEFTKDNMYTYSLIVTETNNLNYGYNYLGGEESNKWVALTLEFNMDSRCIRYNTINSVGEWALNYSLDNDNIIYHYSAQLDSVMYGQSSNTMLLWIRTNDEPQTFSFIDAEGNPININVSFVTLPDIEEEPETTYTIYENLNADLSTTTTVENNIDGTGRNFVITFTSDIPYTEKVDDSITQSGNWVNINITPLAGHVAPTELLIDSVAVPLPEEGSGDEEQETPSTPYLYTANENGTLNIAFMFSVDKSSFECTFTWGEEYIDTVVVNHESNLLYPDVEETM